MRHPIAVVAAVIAVAIAPAVAGAQPACAAGTLASYLALGSAGCTIGTVAVTQFAVVQPLADLGRVTLTPYSRAEGEGNVVGFAVAFVAPLSASWTYTGIFDQYKGVAERFQLDFTLTAGAGNAIRGLWADDLVATATRTLPYVVGSGATDAGGAVGGVVGGAFTATVLAIRSESECAAIPGACTGNNAPRALGIPQQVSGRFNLAAAAGVLGGAFGYTQPQPNTLSATLSSFRGGYYVAPLQVVPEPATWAMLATGLLAVGGVSRRRRGATG